MTRVIKITVTEILASVWKKMGEELNTSGEFYVIVIINYYINISMVTNYKKN